MALMYLVLPEGEEYEAVDRWDTDKVALCHDATDAADTARVYAKYEERPYVVCKVVQVSYHPARG